MSIIPNCHEYLLTIAEKVIDTFADTTTLHKYYALKDSLTRKYSTVSQGSEFTLRQPKASKSVEKFRKSLGLQSSKYTNRSKSRSSFGKSACKKSSTQMGKGRVQTFYSQMSSKKYEDNHIKKQDGISQEYSILNELVSLLKNAQNCPSLLKTLKFSIIPQNERMSQYISSIQTSLSQIYQKLTDRSQTFKQSSKTDASNQIALDDALIDNKWLICTLDGLVSQNKTLRRMVGGQRVLI